MDKAYELFCFADPVFYDSPTAVPSGDHLSGDSIGFAIARGPVPEGWERHDLEDWLVYMPEDARLPPQGWKIHASACLDNAGAILAAVWDYCIPRRVPFKFIRNLDFLLFRNGKYAHRGSSGKFVTIYPVDEAQLEVVLTELGAILDGQPGPYILSDLRWAEGPLYVRYGGFAELYCMGANGEVEAAIIDEDGELVPDRRDPVFKVPAFATLPRCLEPHLAARNSTTIKDLPYRIDRVIHFSNAGGLYCGTDKRTGEQVVLKEARPHAGLSVDKADAVTRLQRERMMLERLAGLDIVPAVRDYFEAGEHHFLVQEFVEGTELTAMISRRYPLVQPELDEATAADYADWALKVCGQVEQAVALVHDRGIVIGDVHPSNVLVRPDATITLIDLEIAWDASERRGQSLADPAFMPTDGRKGIDIDRYALACMRLFVFMPLTMLLGLDKGKAAQLAAEIAAIFPVPDEFLASAVREITRVEAPAQASTNGAGRHRGRELDPTPLGWRRARESMAKAIAASATPQRDDRLFPGDIKQFANAGGGLNLAYGAAGVLYALAATGAGRNADHDEWLIRRALDPQPGTPLGFYDGLHGVAYALEHLGHRDEALKVLDICVGELDGKRDHFGLDLFSGLSGIALNLAHFAAVTGDAALRALAWETADSVADRLGDVQSVPEVSGGEHPYAGLLRGSSGPALLFLRMHAETGDPALLDLAATALRQDLRRCVHREEDGALEVNEGWRTMPYLVDGSVGIGLVLDEYLGERDDDELAQASADARKAAAAQFYIEPGLFYGRAGIILYLSRLYPRGEAREDPLVAAQIRRMAWHAVKYKRRLAFPGEQLLRLSMDLASGTAGIMLALGAALHDAPVQLPFLEPRSHAGQLATDRELLLAGGRR